MNIKKFILYLALGLVSFHASAAKPIDFKQPANSYGSQELYERHSFCGGFFQAIYLKDLGDYSVANTLSVLLRGTYSSVPEAAQGNMYKHQQAAAYMAGKVDQGAWNKGGMTGADLVMTGNVANKAMPYIMMCRSLPQPTTQTRNQAEASQDTFSLANEGNQCIGVMSYYANENGRGQSWQKPMRLRATYLQAWMIENNRYQVDRVAAALSDLGDVELNLDHPAMKSKLEQVVKNCVSMYNREIGIDVK